MKRSMRNTACLAVTVLCVGCTVGPNYVKPSIPTPSRAAVDGGEPPGRRSQGRLVDGL
jgi:hypothetical protein